MGTTNGHEDFMGGYQSLYITLDDTKKKIILTNPNVVVAKCSLLHVPVVAIILCHQ